MMTRQLSIAVSDSSQVGEARRAAAALARDAALDETAAGRLAIIVTELATNLVRHAVNGQMILRGYSSPNSGGLVEVIAIDSGPGFDAARCMSDGYSTGGTAGNGLGAIARLASTFDLYSSPPAGSVILAAVSESSKTNARTDYFQWSCITRPAPGETVCGDDWAMDQTGNKAAFMIADGLGHGPDAAAAATHASMVFSNQPLRDPVEYMDATHQGMAGTRGAAVAYAHLDGENAKVRFCGVGNIAATLYSPSARQGLPSHNGIVGLRFPKAKAFEYDLPDQGMLIMHSDGLQSRWSLANYPGLAQRHPAVIAGVLLRDFYRGRDDVTILVGAWRKKAGG